MSPSFLLLLTQRVGMDNIAVTVLAKKDNNDVSNKGFTWPWWQNSFELLFILSIRKLFSFGDYVQSLKKSNQFYLLIKIYDRCIFAVCMAIFGTSFADMVQI